MAKFNPVQELELEKTACFQLNVVNHSCESLMDSVGKKDTRKLAVKGSKFSLIL